MASIEHKKLFRVLQYNLSDSLRSLYQCLDINMTNLFLELLKQKDKELLTVLEEIFRGGDRLVLNGRVPTENNKHGIIYQVRNLSIYLAEKNKTTELKTLFDCGMDTYICGSNDSYAMVMNAIKNDSIELFQTVKGTGMLRSITPCGLLDGATKFNSLKILKYIMEQWGTIYSGPVEYWQLVSLKKHKNDIALCIILPHAKPEAIQKYCKKLRYRDEMEFAEKIERWSGGLTLHQRCIIAVKCSDIEIPEWFPPLLLEF